MNAATRTNSGTAPGWGRGWPRAADPVILPVPHTDGQERMDDRDTSAGDPLDTLLASTFGFDSAVAAIRQGAAPDLDSRCTRAG